MTNTRFTLGIGSLIALAVLFLACVVLANTLLRGWRIDLTEDSLYTLSEGTREIVQQIDEPINLYYFFSERASEEIPSLKLYARRVRELLEEIADIGGERIRLEVIDPLPFSEAEDLAVGYGLQAVPVGNSGESIFFGLAGTNAAEGEEVIPFFQLDKENFLEYDITRLIYDLNRPQAPVVGLMSSLPISGGFDPMTQRPRQAWVVVEQLRQLFDVREVSPDSGEIPEDLDVLMVVHPKDLSENTLYALDQYALSGGRLLVFVDPHAEIDQTNADPRNPSAAVLGDKSSDLDRLFDAWGLVFDDERVVLDSRWNLAITLQAGARPVPHPAILSVPSEGMSADDVAVGRLDTLNFATAGQLSLADDTAIEWSPLAFSTEDASSTVAVDRVRFLSDPTPLLTDFRPDDVPHVLAARLSGEVASAFDGPPEGLDEASHLGASSAPLNAVVVSDVDFLADRLWVQVQSFFGQRLATQFASNGDFVLNTLENLAGSSELISLRGRSTGRRPFEKVEDLRREAGQRLRETEQQLQDELQSIEQRLTELQTRGPDDNVVVLSSEVQQELRRFEDERLRVRKELRAVRRDLDRDIEELGITLKAINIGLIPILLTIVALSVAVWRRRTLREARA